MVDENLHGKYFSITDRSGVTTVIYKVNRTEKEFLRNSPKYTVERLEFTEEFVGEKKKKTFYITNPAPEGNPLIILSFAEDKVIINMGFLDYDIIKISKRPMPMRCETLYYEEETDYKDFAYTPNMKRPITIIDPESGEEIKPILYFDEEANEVKGKCKLKPYKKYFAFEVRQK